MPRVNNATLQRIVGDMGYKKFDKKLKAAELKLRTLLNKEIARLQKGLVFPKELIDKGYLRTSTVVYLRRRWDYSTTVDPYVVTANNSVLVIELKGKILEAHRAENKLVDEKDRYILELRGILRAFNTDKKILENIPEMKEYLDVAEPATKMTTDIIPVAKINDIRKDLVGMKKKGDE